MYPDMQAQVLALSAAYEDGQAWARGLAPGDLFRGAMPVARDHYRDQRLVDMFVSGALDYFKSLKRGVSTDTDGVIIEIR